MLEDREKAFLKDILEAIKRVWFEFSGFEFRWGTNRAGKP